MPPGITGPAGPGGGSGARRAGRGAVVGDMPSAEYGALVQLERSAVVAAVQKLSGRQREAIVLRY